MKRIENTKVNRLAQCEKEIELINKELMDPSNFAKNKHFEDAQIKMKGADSDGSRISNEQL